MKYQVLIRNAFKAISKNRKRSILTTLGIIIGISAVITIVAIGRGFESYVISNISPDDGKELSVNVMFRSTAFQSSGVTSNTVFFNELDLEKLKSIEGVDKVEFLQEKSATKMINIASPDGNIIAVTNLVKKNNIPVTKGRNLSDVDEATGARVITISTKLAKDMFKGADEYIGRGIEIDGKMFTVVGTYENTGSFNLFSATTGEIQILEKTYHDNHDTNGNNNIVKLILKKGVAPKAVVDEAIRVLKENGSMRQYGSYQALDFSAITEGIGKVLGGVTIFVSAVAGISLFIAGIGMMNMMYISVSERTKEIGIRRALGATKREIRLQFLLEGMMVTVFGGIVGYVLGIMFAFIISNFLPFPVKLEIQPALLALGISMAIGIVFSYSPANSASNKNVIEIL